MKKTLLLLAALVVCGLSFAKPVDVNTARQVAVNFWNLKTTSTYDGFTVTSIVNPNFEEISATLGSIVATPHSGDCSFRLISPPIRFPPLAGIGGSSLDPQ